MSARKPSRKVVQHSGRTTTTKPQQQIVAAHGFGHDLTEATHTAVARAQMRTATGRLQQLVDFSPEAAAAMRRIATVLAPAPDEQPEFEMHVPIDPSDCSHDSASGIDMTAGPDKVWRCDLCGWLHRWTPGPNDDGAMVAVAVQ